MIKLTMVLCIVVSLLGSVQAQSLTPDVKETCDAIEVILTRALKFFSTSKVTGVLKGEEAARFMRGYNEIPPQTDTEADHVVVLEREDHAAAMIIIGNKGCMVATGGLPKEIVRSLMHTGVAEPEIDL
jgi:hypothetical protein